MTATTQILNHLNRLIDIGNEAAECMGQTADRVLQHRRMVLNAVATAQALRDGILTGLACDTSVVDHLVYRMYVVINAHHDTQQKLTAPAVDRDPTACMKSTATPPSYPPDYLLAVRGPAAPPAPAVRPSTSELPTSSYVRPSPDEFDHDSNGQA